MPQVLTSRRIVLEYETAGSPDDPALLLIMGFGAQLIAWRREFLQLLADGGRYVIAFDNRDSGLSSKLDGEDPDIAAIAGARARGDGEEALRLAPYGISDMARDAVDLLDALGIERAHVLGASMGGMIAQALAIEHPERVLTLTSMMSTTGEPEFGQSSPEALAVLLTPSPADRDAYVAAAERTAVWRSRRYTDMEEVRALAAESYDRCHDPAGVRRQFAAIIASGSRADELRELRVPTLVIHGLDDTLITPSGGERTAELIPGARLLLVEDMGHDRPRELWPLLLEAILEHTATTR